MPRLSPMGKTGKKKMGSKKLVRDPASHNTVYCLLQKKIKTTKAPAKTDKRDPV